MHAPLAQQQKGGRILLTVLGEMGTLARAMLRARQPEGLQDEEDRGRPGGRPKVVHEAPLTSERAIVEPGLPVRAEEDRIPVGPQDISDELTEERYGRDEA